MIPQVYIKRRYNNIWINFLEYKLGVIDDRQYPRYIHDKFHAFTLQMSKITLDLKSLSRDCGNARFLKLLFVGTDGGIMNVLSREVSKSFPYIKLIEIQIDSKNCDLCLLSLLNEIEGYPFGPAKTMSE